MNKLFSTLTLASLLIVGGASSLAAQDMDGLLTRTEFDVRVRQTRLREELAQRAAADQALLDAKQKHHDLVERKAPGAVTGPTAVPELDPSAAASALALLIGGALVLTGARRRQAARS